MRKAPPGRERKTDGTGLPIPTRDGVHFEGESVKASSARVPARMGRYR